MRGDLKDLREREKKRKNNVWQKRTKRRSGE